MEPGLASQLLQLGPGKTGGSSNSMRRNRPYRQLLLCIVALGSTGCGAGLDTQRRKRGAGLGECNEPEMRHGPIIRAGLSLCSELREKSKQNHYDIISLRNTSASYRIMQVCDAQMSHQDEKANFRYAMGGKKRLFPSLHFMCIVRFSRRRSRCQIPVPHNFFLYSPAHVSFPFSLSGF